MDIDRIVYASTGAVYGKAEGPIEENTLYNPADVYGATKVIGEVITSSPVFIKPAIGIPVTTVP